MSHEVYIALGTNLGDRFKNLKDAMVAMSSFVDVQECSPVYETPPWGYVEQPGFLNQVIRGETNLAATDLLASLKRVEGEMGRVKTVRYGARVIDLDILFYDDLILELPGLSVPHPRLRGRGFVLVPLADLSPDLLHPEYGLTVRQLLDEADTADIELFVP